MGNYWIWSIYEPRYQPLLFEPNNWCKENIYKLGLAHLLSYYAYMALLFVLTITLTIITQIPCLIMKFQDS